MKLLAALLLPLLGAGAFSQTIPAWREAGILYLGLEPLAQALGYSSSAGPNSLTVRADEGVLTVFDASADVLWLEPGAAGEAERSLSAPVLRREGEWFVPETLLSLFRISRQGEVLLKTDGRRFPLALTETVGEGAAAGPVALAPGVSGLGFYAPGSAGAETLSLLVVDAGLLALLEPAEQGRLDALLATFEDAKPLYFVLTALADSTWSPSFVVEQGDSRLELSPPYGVGLLEGDAERVGPEAPVVGLILLPSTVNLRQPLTLTWQGQSSSLQFRR